MLNDKVAPYYLHGGKEFIYTHIRHNDAYGLVMRSVQKCTLCGCIVKE